MGYFFAVGGLSELSDVELVLQCRRQGRLAERVRGERPLALAGHIPDVLRNEI